jgi:hypothetical protein
LNQGLRTEQSVLFSLTLIFNENSLSLASVTSHQFSALRRNIRCALEVHGAARKGCVLSFASRLVLLSWQAEDEPSGLESRREVLRTVAEVYQALGTRRHGRSVASTMLRLRPSVCDDFGRDRRAPGDRPSCQWLGTNEFYSVALRAKGFKVSTSASTATSRELAGRAARRALCRSSVQRTVGLATSSAGRCCGFAGFSSTAMSKQPCRSQPWEIV